MPLQQYQSVTENLIPGDILPVRVVKAGKQGILCKTPGGHTGLMQLSRCRICRVSHPEQMFEPGQRIIAAVLDIHRATGNILLTGREVLGSWQENAAGFRQGQLREGRVGSVKPYGIFVELAPNLAGLAEYQPNLKPGDGVQVRIRAILKDKHKIKLDICSKLSQPPEPGIPEYFITSGHIRRWEYYPGSPAVTVFSPCPNTALRPAPAYWNHRYSK